MGTELLRPLGYLFERGRLEAVQVLAALMLIANKAGIRQHAQMLRDGLPRNATFVRETGDGQGPAAGEAIDQPQTRRIAESGEHRCTTGGTGGGRHARTGHAKKRNHMFAL